MISGAKSLMNVLLKEGVDTIFGYPGGAILPVYDELSRQPIRHILTRSEQGAAHAAGAYSLISGKVGVCMATSGPGATNLVTGLANAYMDSTPLVAITGQVATTMVGTDAFQEVDITGISQPITKHNYLITNVEDLAEAVEEAFYIARTGRPGPVLVDIPKNVAEAQCSGTIPEQLNLPGYKPTLKGHVNQIKNACKMLEKAERPVLYVGGGVLHARALEPLLELAERLGAAVVVTLMGKGCFPESHALHLGMPGMHGVPAANLALCEADVVLALGARFADRVTGKADQFAKQATIIHVDIDPAEINKNVGPNIPIVGDCGRIMREMLERLPQRDNPGWRARIAELKQRNDYLIQRAQPGPVLTSRYVVNLLNDYLDERAIVTTDVGQHQMTAAQYYRGGYGGRYLTSGGLGTMGYGVPAALGAQLADPEATVVCITGDGSLQMTGNEMATIAGQGLPVKILLFNNSCLALVRQLERVYYKPEQYYAVDLAGNPDFVKLAEAYGFAAYRVEQAAQAPEVLREAMSNGRPTLIECLTDKEDMVYPMVKAGAMLDDMIME